MWQKDSLSFCLLYCAVRVSNCLTLAAISSCLADLTLLILFSRTNGGTPERAVTYAFCGQHF